MRFILTIHGAAEAALLVYGLEFLTFMRKCALKSLKKLIVLILKGNPYAENTSRTFLSVHLSINISLDIGFRQCFLTKKIAISFFHLRCGKGPVNLILSLKSECS